MRWYFHPAADGSQNEYIKSKAASNVIVVDVAATVNNFDVSSHHDYIYVYPEMFKLPLRTALFVFLVST